MYNNDMNKTQLTAKCREIRDKYKYKYVEGEDLDFLLKEILPWHENYEEKTAGGIKYITVKTYKDVVNGFTSWCFYIIHDDNSEIDWSFTHCIANKPKNLCIKD